MDTVNMIWGKDEIQGNIPYEMDEAEISEKNAWHHLFKFPQWMISSPDREVMAFGEKYLFNPTRDIAARVVLPGKKMHDLGCGGGRHVTYFAEKGWDVTGSDLSCNALDFVEQELKRRELKARLVQCYMTLLPFADGEFDVTLARAVINHANLTGLKKSVFEVARTLKNGGLFFVTFSSKRASDWKKGIEVEKNLSYIPENGPEKGLIHTYLNAAGVACLLSPFFRIEEMYLCEHDSLILSAPGQTDTAEYFGSEYVVVCVRE